MTLAVEQNIEARILLWLIYVTKLENFTVKQFGISCRVIKKFDQ